MFILLTVIVFVGLLGLYIKVVQGSHADSARARGTIVLFTGAQHVGKKTAAAVLMTAVDVRGGFVRVITISQTLKRIATRLCRFLLGASLSTFLDKWDSLDQVSPCAQVRWTFTARPWNKDLTLPLILNELDVNILTPVLGQEVWGSATVRTLESHLTLDMAGGPPLLIVTDCNSLIHFNAVVAATQDIDSRLCGMRVLLVRVTRSGVHHHHSSSTDTAMDHTQADITLINDFGEGGREAFATQVMRQVLRRVDHS